MTPNFFVVGAPKAGTSSLYEYLKDHPEIYLPEQKELHFWSCKALMKNTSGPGDKLALKNIVKNWGDYSARYKYSQTKQQLGDVSPSYLYFYDHVIPLLKQKIPTAKIVITLRDPVDRAYSNYLHQQRLTYEPLSFPEALESESLRAESGYSDFWRYVDHSKYFEACDAYVNAFGIDNVFILTFEELRDSPEDTMVSLFKFLDVDESHVSSNLGKVYNVGGVYRANILTNFFLRPSRAKSFFYNLLPASWAEGYKTMKGKNLNANSLSVVGIDPVLRRELAEKFEGDVRRLASKFNVNVSVWRSFDDA